VPDVSKPAKLGPKVRQRLAGQLGPSSHAVGQVPVGTALGLEAVLVTAARGSVPRPINIEATNRADARHVDVEGGGPAFWVVVDRKAEVRPLVVGDPDVLGDEGRPRGLPLRETDVTVDDLAWQVS
jgi:hypothetical protein